MKKYNDNIPKNQDGDYSFGREARWIEGIKLVLDLLTKKWRLQNIMILDVGCGDGSFFRFLLIEAKKNKINTDRIKYSGLDSDPSFGKTIKKMGGKFICADFLNFNKAIKSQKYDVIIASEVIEHIDETDKFIRGVKKVLKQDGYIYLTTPNLAAWHCRLMLLFGYQPLPTEVSNISSVFGKGIIGKKYYSKKTIHHVRIFTHIALREFLQFHGLNIVQAFGGGYRKLDKLLFRKMFVGLAPVITMILKKNRL